MKLLSVNYKHVSNLTENLLLTKMWPTNTYRITIYIIQWWLYMYLNWNMATQGPNDTKKKRLKEGNLIYAVITLWIFLFVWPRLYDNCGRGQWTENDAERMRGWEVGGVTTSQWTDVQQRQFTSASMCLCLQLWKSSLHLHIVVMAVDLLDGITILFKYVLCFVCLFFFYQK